MYTTVPRSLFRTPCSVSWVGGAPTPPQSSGLGGQAASRVYVNNGAAVFVQNPVPLFWD
jgi:hypothetical protein